MITHLPSGARTPWSLTYPPNDSHSSRGLRPSSISPTPRLHRTSTPRGHRHAAPPPCGASNIRQPKDPKAFASMDELREHLERGEVAPAASEASGGSIGGFKLSLPTITGIIKFMGQVNMAGRAFSTL